VLVESKNVRQEPGAGRRRWFESDSCDLVVWYGLDRPEVEGFQILYRENLVEHALTWRQGGGFAHSTVDSGSASPFKNLTPILTPNGAIPWAAVQREFAAHGAELDPALRELVGGRLEARA